MLQVIIPEIDLFDDAKQEFIISKGGILQLEHSLLSLSKWEAKWCKPFISKETKTDEQALDYVKCMTINQNVSPIIYDYIPGNILREISEYIDAPMTATWFNEEKNTKKNKDVITSEIIYYWMIAQNIPMECQKWHLNRLVTLINVCRLKNNPPKNKMNNSEMLANRRALNEARRQQFNTKG